MIATIDGEGASPEGGTLLALPDVEPKYVACLLAQWNSFAFDFVARQKVGGTHLKYFTLKQLPSLPPSAFDRPPRWGAPLSLVDWILARVIELTYTAWEINSFAAELTTLPDRPYRWDAKRRNLMRAEIDACMFHEFGFSRKDVEYALETFPIVKRKDEAKYGEYRSKRLILEVYDRMTEAIRTGEQYQTILDPPPGEGPRHPAKQEGR